MRRGRRAMYSRTMAPSLRMWILSVVAFLVATGAVPAIAESDFVGDWQNRLSPEGFHEDHWERWEGPYPGDYLGFPLNDAGRQKADSYDASLLTVPEHQCMPHPSTYAFRSPTSIRITKQFEPDSMRLIAFNISGNTRRAARNIWMDGRPHPSAYAMHTWEGFSTGSWEGHVLRVETTHLKAGWLSRNGVPHSERATMSEYFFRRGDYLSVLTLVRDPVYLTEPFVRSTEFILNKAPSSDGQPFYRCFGVSEVAKPESLFPHYLLGQNQYLHEFATRFHVPFEATRGGSQTIYPEYSLTLQQHSADLRK